MIREKSSPSIYFLGWSHSAAQIQQRARASTYFVATSIDLQIRLLYTAFVQFVFFLQELQGQGKTSLVTEQRLVVVKDTSIDQVGHIFSKT